MRGARTPARRLGGIGLGLAVLVLSVATAVPAQAGEGPGTRGERNRRIAVGDIRVVAGEVVDGPLIGIDGDARVAGVVDGSVFVARGDVVVTVRGEVDGDVIVLRGDARIEGRVDGDVTVIQGRAVVGSDAVVDGDVRSSDEPRVARGARVTGDVEDIDLSGILAAFGAGLLLFWWFAVTVSTAALGALLLALVPRGMEVAASAGRSARTWWVAALVGAGLVVALPVVAIALVSSLVGLPFGLGLLGALGLVHAIGYVAGALLLGRLLVRPPANRFGAFFAGWAILRAVALVPVLGLLAWIVAVAFGLGTMAVAGVRAGRGPRPEAAAVTPGTVPPNAAATPSGASEPTTPVPARAPTESSAPTTPEPDA